MEVTIIFSLILGLIYGAVIYLLLGANKSRVAKTVILTMVYVVMQIGVLTLIANLTIAIDREFGDRNKSKLEELK